MTSEGRTIQDDVSELSSAVGDAFYPVWDFVAALEEGDFRLEGAQWVYRPNNFITITVHSERAHNVTVCLRGKPSEFPNLEHLPLAPAMGGYSRFKMIHISQLDAALVYIRRSHILSKRGPRRIQTRIRMVEG